MAISANLEALGYGSPSRCIATGLHREIITGVGTTRFLLPGESGALCIFDQATTQTWTLPVPVAGMQFEFFWGILRSGTHKITTSGATVFMLGCVMAGDPSIATSGDVFEADGTSIVSYITDGNTKGGYIGSNLHFTALNSTQWAVRGLVIGTGTMATGFA